MIDLDADTLTLRRRPVVVEQYDGTPPPFAIVQSSPVVSRRPRGDESLSMLLHLAMRTPETFQPPTGCEYCSTCGDWRPRSYFPQNASRKGRGIDYECRQCQNERKRQHRVLMAAAEGRELRKYYKAA